MAAIEKKFDDFLAQGREAGDLFARGLKAYLTGYPATFHSSRSLTGETERYADTLRHDIEEALYSRTLIPQSRGDVLRLIESLDSLIGRYKETLWRLEIERPQFDETFVEDFLNLVECVVSSVDAIICGIDAFLKHRSEVKEKIKEVSRWETKADVASTHLQTLIFRHEGLDLSQRMHLRDFVRQVDKIADLAEDLADSLSIHVLKRAL